MLKILLISSYYIINSLFSFVVTADTNDEKSTVYYIGTNKLQAINDDYAHSMGINLIKLNLDGHINLEKKISEGLPDNNYEEAERIANERLEKLDPEFVKQSFQGIALMVQWEITKAPAFVFDGGRQVIYGVTDTKQALKRWNYYRMRH